MDDMNENKFKQLKATLCGGNEKNDHRYYVYGLFEKGKPYPFYIGKGQNARVFQHEAEYQEIYDSIKDEPDFKSRKEDFSKKLKTIGAAKGIEKVIIKWGLTSSEAYMCESALINLYQYMVESGESKKLQLEKLQLEKLTNAVIGHASDLEKANKAGTTKAWSVQDFLDNCALEELDISAGARGEPPIKYPVIFIRINQLYKELILKNKQKDDKEIQKILKEITRGSWPISENIRNYIQTHQDKTFYIAGMYQQVVKCVYKVENIYGKRDFDNPDKVPFLTKTYMTDENRKETLALELLEFQSKNLNEFIEKIQKYQEEHPNFNFPFGKECAGDCANCSHREDSCALKEYCKKDGTLKKQFEKWKCRKFFTVNDDVPQDLRDKLMNHLITSENDPSFLSSAQNSFTKNFDIKAGEIQLRDQIYFLRKHICKKLSGTKCDDKDLRKRKEDFLNDLVNNGKLSGDGDKTNSDFSLNECLSDKDSKKENIYYKLGALLAEEEPAKTFDDLLKKAIPEAEKKK